MSGFFHTVMHRAGFGSDVIVVAHKVAFGKLGAQERASSFCHQLGIVQCGRVTDRVTRVCLSGLTRHLTRPMATWLYQGLRVGSDPGARGVQICLSFFFLF